MNKKHACALALALGLTALLPACRHIRSAGMVVASYPQTQVKDNDTIFGKRFRVTQTAVDRMDSGLLRATITIENVDRRSCQFEYRYRWLDANGIEVTSGLSVWTPQSAASREQKLLTGVAPNRQAADFILDIRFSHKSTRW